MSCFVKKKKLRQCIFHFFVLTIFMMDLSSTRDAIDFVIFLKNFPDLIDLLFTKTYNPYPK